MTAFVVWSKRLAMLAAGVVICYISLEVAFHSAVRFGLLHPGVVTGLAEDAGDGGVQFDPVIGFRLPKNETRFAVFNDGKLRATFKWKANNAGFSDGSDFQPARTQANIPRYIVLGDSFTVAPYLARNWPQAVEDYAAAQGHPVELMNMAMLGGGICNWWNILTKMVAPEGWDVDGLILSIFVDDLERPFFAMDTVDGQVGMHYCSIPWARRWNPDRWPREAADIERLLVPVLDVVPAASFDYAVSRGRYLPWKPYLATVASLAAQGRIAERRANPGGRRDMQLVFYRDIRRIAEERSWRVLVTTLPPKGTFRSNAGPSSSLQDLTAILEPDVLDLSPAFDGWTEDEISERFFEPNDDHWNQAGSDLAVPLIYERLLSYSASADSPAVEP
ncbi:MAG: hypothetical protein IT368_00650 [Candidatus Hydrogenedentes bacterium]|nr:hypothetical protein [Candidatus Hydrogenedentota bacterium]